MVFYSFTLVFMYSINKIYIANLVYYLLLIDAIKKKKFCLNNKLAFLLLGLFLLWAVISTTVYAVQNGNITGREIVQFLFTCQYIILIISFNLEKSRLEVWIYRFATLQSLLIVCLFAYLYYPGILSDDLWAANYIPGWPNSPPIPLLMGLWMSYRMNKGLIVKALLCVGLFLTTSRTAMVGCIAMILYFLINKAKEEKKYILFIAMLIIMATAGINYWISIDPLVIRRLTVTWDRVDIFWTTMSYLKLRPLLGYGGNTIDQIGFISTSYTPAKNWGHTHNWILEILLRYGIIGFLLFSGYLLAIFLQIQDKDKRAMFILLLTLALFQNYIRDFIFLFCLAYLATGKQGRCATSANYGI